MGIRPVSGTQGTQPWNSVGVQGVGRGGQGPQNAKEEGNLLFQNAEGAGQQGDCSLHAQTRSRFHSKPRRNLRLVGRGGARSLLKLAGSKLCEQLGPCCILTGAALHTAVCSSRTPKGQRSSGVFISKVAIRPTRSAGLLVSWLRNEQNASSLTVLVHQPRVAFSRFKGTRFFEGTGRRACLCIVALAFGPLCVPWAAI